MFNVANKVLLSTRSSSLSFRRSTSYYNKKPSSSSPPLPFSFSSPSSAIALPSVLPQVTFVVGLSGFAFVLAAYQTNEDTELRLSQSLSSTLFRLSRTVTERDLVKQRYNKMIESSNRMIARVGGEQARAMLLASEWWARESEARRTCWAIIGINSVVFLAWKSRSLMPVMMRTFLHDPLSSRSITLLGSVFSHKALFHFGLNSIALISIGSAASEYFGRPSRIAEGEAFQLRSTPRYEFIAFYIAAGLAASLTSHLYTIRFVFRRALKSIPPSVPRILPSLGASGAIYACLSITAMAYPTASVAIIFLPFIPIPISYAYWSMITLDLVGLLRGWKLFDHAAHLGGAGFGLLYFTYGGVAFERLRLWVRGIVKGGGGSSREKGVKA